LACGKGFVVPFIRVVLKEEEQGEGPVREVMEKWKK
jgi:hypothetical protein